MDSDREFSSSLAPGGDAGVIKEFKLAVSQGKPWYLALLEAVGSWSAAEEIYQGRVYRYLIAGEAFDFLRLAERLCEAAGELIPDGEKTALLFHGRPPLTLSPDEFKSLIGAHKYRQHLNYFYGVRVEEALFLTVQDEVRKERRAAGYGTESDNTNEIFRRLYGTTKGVLLKRFRKEMSYPHLKSTSLTEMAEFTYWLFKNRLKESDKARVASDTRKALKRLVREGLSRGPTIYEPPEISD